MPSSPVFASLAFVASCARRKAAAPTTIAAVATRRAAATAADITIVNSNSNTNVNLRSFRKVINSRISARRFQPNTLIPNAVWKDILSMTLTSPSGFNLQPTHIILLQNARLKSLLSEHAMLGMGNKYRTLDASGIAIFCTDLMPGRRIDRIYQLESESGVRDDGYMAVMKVASSFLTGEGSVSGRNYGNSGSSSQNRISTFLKRTVAHALSPIQPMPTMEDVESWSYKNAGIMSSIYTLSATAHGLSTCMMEGYDARRVKEILRVPDRYGIPLMVATGYEYRGEETDDAMVHLPSYVHADFLACDDGNDDDAEEEEGASRSKRKTPRLDMSEVFFGDTFGEPLDFLLDNHIIEKAQEAARRM